MLSGKFPLELLKFREKHALREFLFLGEI
jgi:hypothetical protein